MVPVANPSPAGLAAALSKMENNSFPTGGSILPRPQRPVTRNPHSGRGAPPTHRIGAPMGPISTEIEIDVPREQAFAALADLSQRPSFTDHFLTGFHLLRLDPVGV